MKLRLLIDVLCNTFQFAGYVYYVTYKWICGDFKLYDVGCNSLNNEL